MTNVATLSGTERYGPLEHARACVEVFCTLFSELFVSRGSRFIPRKLHAQASDFLRGIEAVLRRALLVRAAALIPTLPPARPRKLAPKMAPRRVAAGPKPRSASFSGLVLRCVHTATRKPPSPNDAPPPSSDVIDIGAIARRYEAIMQVLADAAPATRRTALRLRAFVARHGEPPVVEGELRRPQLPEHVAFFRRDLAVFATDANEAFRELKKPDSS